MAIIVLDKSYLQAVRRQDLLALDEHNELVVTGSLFYELLTGDEEARRRVFAKLPQRDNPVRLLDNVSSLLTHESTTHTSAGNVLNHELGFAFKFNPRLMEPGYQLPADALEGIRENEELTRSFVELNVLRTNAVVDMFRAVTTGSDSTRRAALAEIEQEIKDPERVLEFYRSLNDPELPPPDLLTPEWATFRLYQTSLLFSLHSIHRHRGQIPTPLSVTEFEKLEHDFHDQVGLCTGILAGGFATNEKKLQRWCALLNPAAILIST